jgi:hypothetical protein
MLYLGVEGDVDPLAHHTLVLPHSFGRFLPGSAPRRPVGNVGSQPVPAEGRLFYRGWDVSEVFVVG